MESDPDDQFETAVGIACCSGCFLMAALTVFVFCVAAALGAPL